MKTQKRIIIANLIVICILSGISFFSILHYMDPYQNKILSLVLLFVTFIFSLSSFFTVFLYFIKKIYFRGEVSLYHIFSSLRQAFFINLFAVAVIVFMMYHIPILIPALAVGFLLLFLELLWKNLEN